MNHLPRKYRSKKLSSKIVALCAAVGISSSITGCDMPLQQMESSHHAVVFSALPRFLGGGVKSNPKSIIPPAGKVIVFPWESLYRFDTSVQSIGWGGMGQGEDSANEDFVETRALDGNEVGLAMTVQYQLDPNKLGYIVQNVGVDDDSVRRLVSSIARADIRTHMNVLRTWQFFDPDEREKAVNGVKAALQERMASEGINILSVIYVDHRFERRLPDQDGQRTYDRRYQEQIDQAQALKQETQQEEKKVSTVIEQKQREFNEAQARVNRVMQESDGYKEQARLRGDAYIQAKSNEAEQVTALGMAEVEGLKKQIAAVSGAGGRALLRLSVARALTRTKPNYILLNSGGDKGSLDVNRVDTNQLLQQIGVFSALSDSKAKPAESAPAVAANVSPENSRLENGVLAEQSNSNSGELSTKSPRSAQPRAAPAAPAH